MSNNKLPNVIILAAGAGNRLKPYTADCPKCMLQLGDKTLIERQLQTLEICGLTNISIITGYLKEKIEALGYPTAVNPDWETTNMVMTLWHALDKLEDDIIISYADIIYQRSVLETLLASDADISVVVDRGFRKYWETRFKNPLDDLESLRISPEGHIQYIGQKVKSIDEIEAQYIGLMRFKGTGLKSLKNYMNSVFKTDRFKKMYMTDLLQDIINQGDPVKAVTISHGWLEIDSLKDYQNARKWFEDGSITEFFDENA